MSDEKQADVQLPDANEAVQFVDGLYCERFFEKMAAYGHVPQNDDAARAMLVTAAQLDAINTTPAVDPYVDAGEKLARVLQQRNGARPQHVKAAADVQERRQLALALATNADLYRSVLSIKAAEQNAAAAQA